MKYGVIKKAKQRPGVVLYSKAIKTVYLIELTLTYECRIEEAHHHKTEKNADLANELRVCRYKRQVYAVEVEARGFHLIFCLLPHEKKNGLHEQELEEDY